MVNYNFSYYIASSASGKMERSGLPAVTRKKNFPESHVINPLLAKFVRSRWLDIGLVLFLRVKKARVRLGP